MYQYENLSTCVYSYLPVSWVFQCTQCVCCINRHNTWSSTQSIWCIIHIYVFMLKIQQLNKWILKKQTKNVSWSIESIAVLNAFHLHNLQTVILHPLIQHGKELLLLFVLKCVQCPKVRECFINQSLISENIYLLVYIWKQTNKQTNKPPLFKNCPSFWLCGYTLYCGHAS